MEIPVVEGKGFIKGETAPNTMIVSESFVDKMVEFAGWTDGVVNKNVFVSEHGEQTICGVFGNILPSSEDQRPAILLYHPEAKPGLLVIKMYQITPEIVEKITAVFQQFLPDQHIVIHNYKEEFKESFSGLRKLSSEMLICGIVTLLIALTGLIGYIHNETNRRRSEIAIRKIHGATTNSVQGLFFKNILITVIPGILFGIIASVVVAQLLQEHFLDTVHISVFVYVLCAVCITSVILAVISIDIYRAAARNPVENLE
jgi:putative ABC transport system permease protein